MTPDELWMSIGEGVESVLAEQASTLPGTRWIGNRCVVSTTVAVSVRYSDVKKIGGRAAVREALKALLKKGRSR